MFEFDLSFSECCQVVSCNFFHNTNALGNELTRESTNSGMYESWQSKLQNHSHPKITLSFPGLRLQKIMKLFASEVKKYENMPAHLAHTANQQRLHTRPTVPRLPIRIHLSSQTHLPNTSKDASILTSIRNAIQEVGQPFKIEFLVWLQKTTNSLIQIDSKDPTAALRSS